MKNHGKVRGGANEYGRLFLVVACEPDEYGALCEGIAERFLLPRDTEWGDPETDRVSIINGIGVCLRCNTRRSLSLVPALVRWASASGRTIRISHWDEPARNESVYPEAGFFRAIAEAACFHDDVVS